MLESDALRHIMGFEYLNHLEAALYLLIIIDDRIFKFLEIQGTSLKAEQFLDARKGFFLDVDDTTEGRHLDRPLSDQRAQLPQRLDDVFRISYLLLAVILVDERDQVDEPVVVDELEVDSAARR